MWKFETTKGGPYFETVRFGDLSWKVLDKSSDGGKVLLLSEDIVEERPYHDDEGVGPDLTWEASDIRAYLNSSFIVRHFSEEEKSRICDTELENNDNPVFGTNGGNDTIDKVFLLSIEEAWEYEYTGDLFVDGELWWLRSPGDSGDAPAFVSDEYEEGEDGEETCVCARSNDGATAPYGVRPALWVRVGR